MKALVNSKKDWEKVKSEIPQRYNVRYYRLTEEPKKFPCVVIVNPTLDVTGITILVDCVYSGDFKNGK